MCVRIVVLTAFWCICPTSRSSFGPPQGGPGYSLYMLIDYLIVYCFVFIYILYIILYYKYWYVVTIPSSIIIRERGDCHAIFVNDCRQCVFRHRLRQPELTHSSSRSDHRIGEVSYCCKTAASQCDFAEARGECLSADRSYADHLVLA